MSEQRPVPPGPDASGAAALRRAGAAPLRPADPDLVGPYVPLALLGSGGMGRVYLARPVDDSPGLVALKVIRPEYAEDARFRRRFEREASVHARLRTPSTPRLCGTGFRDELLWMATEYLPGLDLAEAVREDGALEAATVWQLTACLARALAELAAAGVVHRDLKPSNVLLSVRGAHVIDFGISKAVDSSSLTGTGNRVGTPAYMSPEHLRTGRSDTASDVFSLAGTLVYAATGHAPFGDGTGVDVMHRVAFEEPDPGLLGGIASADPALGALLSACLAKEPGQRPTPQDLVDAAAPHAGASGWAEPLRGRVLARQEAYEVLHRLPAARRSRPNPPYERVPPSVSPAPAPAAEAPGSPVTPPSGGPRPSALRVRGRGKPARAVVAAAALCAVTAGVVFVLTRQDPPAAIANPPTAPAGPASGEAGSLAPGAADGTSPEGRSGIAPHADGAAEDPAGPVTPAPAFASPDDTRPGAPSPSAVESEPSVDVTASPVSPSPTPTDPPWISDCAYYSGKGRTGPGDSGRRVLQVQCMLTERGYAVGDGGVDGEFGAGTESAVRRLQSDKGLTADGVVARETWAALRGPE
ncbi:protein kinase domain-containing protein [Streptomyces canus]|uniref:protein kinase domain-containing protein n=1 Tax=Streptomyces canus TaxID=58343 RepID=UPI003CF82BCB